MLLDLYAKYNVKATFFFIANFAKQHPEIVKMVQLGGHEVALHGLTHDHSKAFDTMSFEGQKEHLSTAKKILEDIAGVEVVSFRAPALRVNSDTPRALIETGFKFDSSIAPQRMDMFMSLGSNNKMQWLKAPREPYHTSPTNLARRGDSPITEVPVSSSFGLPYIGTFIRINPSLTHWVRGRLYRETHNTDKVVNFLIHPNEIITESNLHQKLERRSKNFVKYFLSDVLRHQMKQKNLGPEALRLFEEEVKYWQAKGYTFSSVGNVEVLSLQQ